MNCGRCWPTPTASTRRWACRPMCWRRRRSPTAPCCAAARARRRASRWNGRRSPTSGSRAAISARPATSPRGRSAASGRCSISSPTARAAARVSYALEWEPLTLIGRLFGARLAEQAGGCGGEAHAARPSPSPSGERPTMFDMPPPELPEGARERAAALAAEIDRSPYGNGLGQPARRLCADRHGDRSRASQAQAAGARVRRAAARRHRGLPRRACARAC